VISRREFLKNSAATSLAVSASARSYAQIIGSNDRVNFAVIGLHGRGNAHLSALGANKDTARITHICDVDSDILATFSGAVQKQLGYTPQADSDFRKMLQSKDIDAVSIATPDHLHTTIAIWALQAGKSAYVEKPPSYDPHEGELLVAAQKKYAKLKVQVGSQQRSSPHTIDIIGKIHEGHIGRAYYAQTWYVNNRKSMGIGKEVSVPPTLNWDLFQGPAPRTAYKDNIHPYNWHWLRRFGTGESLNNGTHEVDIARWALQVDFPSGVTASGGRYAFKDDWEFYDTMVTGYTYPGGEGESKMISWEGRCCSSLRQYDRDRGVAIIGTNGSVIVDRDGYEVYDAGGKKTSEFKRDHNRTASSDTVGADAMTNAHFANFIAAIQHGEALRTPIEEGHKSVTHVQLSNIAWETNSALQIDPSNGHILDNEKAQALTHREYEKGWELKV